MLKSGGARGPKGASVAIIQAEGLTRVYGSGETSVTALDHVDLTVDAGEFVAVMGPSGCGKSTLLHLLGGLDRPTEGRVLFDGTDISTMPDAKLTELRRRRMGFVFQFFNLIPVLDATENAALPLILDGVLMSTARSKARDWLTKVGLGDRLGNRPDQLSGGQQQRVAVARALVAEPALVLADEPTGNLDSRSSAEVADLLSQVAGEWGRAVLMVTHDARVAAHADRVVLMKDGRVVAETKPEGDSEAAMAASLVERLETL
jgi:putative ABC transport system ATP-binding protein